jgi:uncharacterized protein YndB with AHSA1/START domain
MPSYTMSATLAAPPERVFAALTDPQNATLLFGAAAGDLRIGPEPLRQGARYPQRRTWGGMTVSGDLVVEALRPPKEFEISAEAKGLRVVARWVLTSESEGAATRVDYECRVQGSGFAAFLAGTVADALRRADAEHLERLRRLVER